MTINKTTKMWVFSLSEAVKSLQCVITKRLSKCSNNITLWEKMLRSVLNPGMVTYPFLLVGRRRRLQVLDCDAEFFGRLNDQLRR
jgi:hypothetical protein